MILAAGLTPAWQQILEFPRFSTGIVNRARSVQCCASGKVLNVGCALQHLGAPQQTLSVVGGPTGELIAADLRQLGIAARLIETDHPTRVCTTILDQATKQTTELVENSAQLPAARLDEYLLAFREELVSAEFVVLSGSLPDATPHSFYRDLIGESGNRVILDARGPELVQALATRPLLVKPNRSELEFTLQRSLQDDSALIEGMKELNRLGAKWVVVSDGAEAIWVASETSTVRFHPPETQIVNPIGCGDCLAAGIATALLEGHAVPDAVQFGIAAAADNLQRLLPARLDRARVGQFIDQIVSDT